MGWKRVPTGMVMGWDEMSWTSHSRCAVACRARMTYTIWIRIWRQIRIQSTNRDTEYGSNQIENWTGIRSNESITLLFTRRNDFGGTDGELERREEMKREGYQCGTVQVQYSCV